MIVENMKNEKPFVKLAIPESSDLFSTDSIANIVTPKFVLVRNFSAVNKTLVPVNKPVISNEFRIGLILRGWIDYQVNIKPVRLEAGMLFVSVPGDIIVLKQCSEDYDAQFVVSVGMGASGIFKHWCLMRMGKSLQQRVLAYFKLMEQVMKNQQFDVKTLHLLTSALCTDIQSDPSSVPVEEPANTDTRQERLFGSFIELLNEHGDRNISFYAEKLGISPNRLSTVIKQYSGLTIMQWINQNTVLQARAMLDYTDYPVFEIAQILGFESSAFFVCFFKRETGMTPTAYRKKSSSTLMVKE